MDIEPSKKFTQNDFLYDYHSKEFALRELIKAIRICHEARMEEGKSHLKCYHNEEKALLEFCQKLGIEISEV